MCPEYESNAQSFHMHFPPIENHYIEQFNVSGLLNEDSDMKKKKELLNHNWKNVAWPDDSRFLLQHSDDRVRIWSKEHESMDPSCLVSMVQAVGGGVMVGGYFLGTL